MKTQFYVVKEGLSELINRLQKDLTDKRCQILLNEECSSIEKMTNTKTTNNKNHQDYTYVINNKYTSSQIVFAIPKKPLVDLVKSNGLLKSINVNKYLNMIGCQPLYRIYAQYQKIKKGKYGSMISKKQYLI